MTEVTFKVFSWDWKDQPDWKEITQYVNNYGTSTGWALYFHEVETDSDCYAVLVADKQLLPEEVALLYQKD